MLLAGGRPWLTGLLLGAGLLIKATFLTAIPAVGLIFAWRCFSAAGARRRIALDAVVTFFTTGAISGWWYWRNHVLTGSWSALQQVVTRGEISPWSLLGHIPGVDWWRFFDIAIVSHIWSGNWSFLHLRSWMYRLLACIALAAAVGLVRKIWHGRDGKSHALVLGSIYAFFWLGLCYHELTFSVLGLSSSAGWYAYAVVAAEILLVVAGLQALCPVRWHGMVPAMGAALFTMLDLYATHFVLLPYYTSLVAHRSGGALVSFQAGRFAELPVMLGRLAVPAPAALLLWLCFLAATLGLPLLTFRGAGGTREDEHSGR